MEVALLFQIFTPSLSYIKYRDTCENRDRHADGTLTHTQSDAACYSDVAYPAMSRVI